MKLIALAIVVTVFGSGLATWSEVSRLGAAFPAQDSTPEFVAQQQADAQRYIPYRNAGVVAALVGILGIAGAVAFRGKRRSRSLQGAADREAWR